MANLNATPATVVLAGKNYVIHPLTDNDNLALDEFVQSRFLQMAHATGLEGVIAIALQDAINIRWSYPPGSRILVRHGGWGRIVFQSLRLPIGAEYFDACKGASKEEIENLIRTYRRINDIEYKPEEKGDTENPTMASIERSKEQ